MLGEHVCYSHQTKDAAEESEKGGIKGFIEGDQVRIYNYINYTPKSTATINNTLHNNFRLDAYQSNSTHAKVPPKYTNKTDLGTRGWQIQQALNHRV